MPTEAHDANALFQTALAKLSAGERAAFLDGAGAGDGDLRRRVEALLDAYERFANLFGDVNSGREVAFALGPKPPTSAPENTRRAALPPPAPEGPGSHIGPYKILQKIGEGGMGVVYMAEQEGSVRRTVALKIIKPGMDSGQVLARFEAERQALALMDHPNIAKVLDGGETGSGRPYFVMELVKGLPLTKYCDEVRLSVRERLGLFVPVCQAVQHAHQKGIIHRDLKPSNILVALYDGLPVPKIIDFGVAKATTSRLTDRTMFTAYGTVVGTIEYMSPEQAELNQLDIDTRSDIYSLGVILYELLTGTTPLGHTRLKEIPLTELLRLIKDEEPARPSTRLTQSATLPDVAAHRKAEPRRLCQLIHGDLDWIVMKALAKERSRRYETANGFAMDAQRYLHDEPVLAGPPGAAYRLRKFARRHKGKVAAAAGAVVLLAAAAGVSALLAVQATQAEARAKEQRDAAARAAARAEAVSTFLTDDLLREASPDENARDKKVTVEQLLERAARKIADSPKFADQPEAEAAVRYAIGKAYYKLGALDQAELHLRRAAELRRAALGPDDRQTLAAQEALADLLVVGLRWPRDAEALSRQTWEARSRVLGADDPDTLSPLDTYASALVNLFRIEEAEALHRRCLDVRTRVLGEEHVDTVTSKNNLANCLLRRQLWEESEPLLRGCVDWHSRCQGPTNIETQVAVNNLCFALRKLRHFDEAERRLKDGHGALSRSHGREHYVTVQLHYQLARVLLDIGRLEEAEAMSKANLELRRKTVGETHETVGWSLVLRGHVLAELGHTREAEPLLTEGLDLFGAKYPHRYDFIAEAETWLGACLLDRDRAAEAETHLRRAWNLYHEKMPLENDGLFAQGLLGAALARQKKFDEAAPLLLASYDRLEKFASPPLPEEKSRLAAAARRLAQLYDDWDKRDQAEAWQKKVAALQVEKKPAP